MSDRRFAWFLIVLAIVARVAAVLVLQSHNVPHSTYEHGEIAANLLAGRGFSVRFLGVDGPTSQQAPVYPWLVAGAYALGGFETPRALLILELGQAVLGGILVIGVLRLCREIAPGPPWVPRGAGLIAALHPTLVYSATHVQVAGIAATLLTFGLASAYRTGRDGSLRAAIATGLWIALLMLTDPILGLSTVGACWAVILGLEVRVRDYLASDSPPCEGGVRGGDRGTIRHAEVVTPPNPPFARGGKGSIPGAHGGASVSPECDDFARGGKGFRSLASSVPIAQQEPVSRIRASHPVNPNFSLAPYAPPSNRSGSSP